MLLGADQVYSCNLGDSRIYRVSPEGQIHQLSLDHVLGGGRFGKPPLTQYLGIPEESMGLEPTITAQEAVIGTRYLICSDGITDMLTDSEIAAVLAREVPVAETAELLVEQASKRRQRQHYSNTLRTCRAGTKLVWKIIKLFFIEYEGDRL